VTKTYHIRKEEGGGVQPVAEKIILRAYEKFPSHHPLDSHIGDISYSQIYNHP